MHRPVTSISRAFRSSVSPSSLNTGLTRLSSRHSYRCVFCRYRPQSHGNLKPFGTSAVSLSQKPAPALSSSPDSKTATERLNGENTPPGLAHAPDITNHYTIFPKTLPRGLPPASPFEVPLAELRREFLALQALVHPDKYPEGTARKHAEALSSRINEAYRTICDPLSRAQYLLASQHNIDVTAEDGAKAHPQDPETLMQVMEAQEEIEEAENEETIEELKKDNESRISNSVRILGEAINGEDVESATKECLKLRFWYTIREGLREWEPDNRQVRLIH